MEEIRAELEGRIRVFLNTQRTSGFEIAVAQANDWRRNSCFNPVEAYCVRYIRSTAESAIVRAAYKGGPTPFIPYQSLQTAPLLRIPDTIIQAAWDPAFLEGTPPHLRTAEYALQPWHFKLLPPKDLRYIREHAFP